MAQRTEFNSRVVLEANVRSVVIKYSKHALFPVRLRGLVLKNIFLRGYACGRKERVERRWGRTKGWSLRPEKRTTTTKRTRIYLLGHDKSVAHTQLRTDELQVYLTRRNCVYFIRYNSVCETTRKSASLTAVPYWIHNETMYTDIHLARSLASAFAISCPLPPQHIPASGVYFPPPRSMNTIYSCCCFCPLRYSK